MIRSLLLSLLVLAAPSAQAQEVVPSEAMRHSIAQLRGSIGLWSAETSYLNEDGSTSRKVQGTYEFAWVVPDRVVSGKSEIPELEQVSGILFYINEREEKIEMVSVGADGRLWIMAGPLGGEVRETQDFETQDGGKARLRFTRFNVSDDSFESKMEYTSDDGATWTPGNHQQFQRIK